MKFPGDAARRVALSLIQAGPATSAVLAERLGMTQAGIRKHIRALVDAGLVEAQDRPPYGPVPERGRGRPGSVFAISMAGRAAAGDSGSDFAREAMRFLAKQPELIDQFAQERAHVLSERLTQSIHESGTDDVESVARALSDDGYAATLDHVSDHVVQLCQHQCPIADVAMEFPQFCEAETQALSNVLGRHVTRLATIAHGDGVCTTLIPRTDARTPTTPSRRKVSA
jgi:predicted ArsR family transcriptional regulator